MRHLLFNDNLQAGERRVTHEQLQKFPPQPTIHADLREIANIISVSININDEDDVEGIEVHDRCKFESSSYRYTIILPSVNS